MRLGFFVLAADPHESAQATYRRLREDAEWADEHGLDTIWLAEHHFDSYGGHVPSTAVAGAAIASWTERVRIGSAVTLLPFRHPLFVAEEHAMVDVLSGGRLEMGVGRGFVPHEFAALGLTQHDQDVRFREGLELLMRCWSGEVVDFEGDAFSVQGAQTLPCPIQRPHPPIWIAASKTRATFELAGRLGHGLMLNPYTRTDAELEDGLDWYREARGAAGHVGPGRILAMQHLFVARTEEEAYAVPRAPLLGYLAAVERAFSRGTPGGTQPLVWRTYDQLYAERMCFGTVERVAAVIDTWTNRGVTDLAFMTRFGGLEDDQVSASLERFASTVGAVRA